MVVEYHDTEEFKALEQTKQKKASSDRKLVESSDKKPEPGSLGIRARDVIERMFR